MTVLMPDKIILKILNHQIKRGIEQIDKYKESLSSKYNRQKLL